MAEELIFQINFSQMYKTLLLLCYYASKINQKE